MMRDNKDGIALAAIVAKETTEGTWRGTGGGVGIGSGGLGLFVGGMSGTKTERTQRAREFRGPNEAAFNWWNVYGMAISIIVGAMLINLAPSIVSTINLASEVQPSPLFDVISTMAHWASMAFFVVGLGVLLSYIPQVACRLT